MPGGCTIGSRPLDIHFKGFEKLGAEVYLENGVIRAQTEQLEGDFTLDFRSVGATENLIMAAVFSPSRVVLRNIATEPEIMNMIDFLNKAGARIRLTGQATVEIEGVPRLSYCEHQIDPDRIEAATLLIAGFASGGEVTLTGAKVEDLKVLLEKLQEMNAKVEIGPDYITVGYQGEILGTTIKTEVHPGFPTDMQSQMCVLMTQASTSSLVIENIFTNRFQHIGELQKMGAKARIEGNIAYIEKSNLTGCRVAGYELRGAASMVMAGILAEGVTRVNNLKYLYRGYEAIIEKFQHLGADIAYV
jgi:UDP-N-acetylglucosamine 1-carboxyvinyltransferase